MFDTTGSLGRRPSQLARALCAAMALVTFASLTPARGDPADIFTISAPVIGAEAPKATPLADGDTSVSEQAGAFHYSYPITVPPGPFTNDPHYPYQGGPWANADVTTGYIGESCALNYQQTSYHNSPGPGGGPLWCAPDFSVCPASGHCANGRDCTAKNLSSQPTTVFAYRWMDIDGDGLVDVVASPVQGGLYDFQQGLGLSGFPAPVEPPLFGPFPPCPTTPFTADSSGPYTMCSGMYPWFVYKNHGNGNFGVQTAGAPRPDQIMYQPVPLETTTGDSSLTSSMVGKTQGMVDIDGDGYLDAVYRDQNDANVWLVFRNDHTGQFGPNWSAGTVPFRFPKAPGDMLNQNDVAPFASSPIVQTAGLVDLNGDGLPDQWAGSGTTANVELNDGVRFRRLPNGIGEVTSAVRPGADAVPD
jgi:hypothetical protein